MPIVRIEALVRTSPDVPALLKAVAAAVAAALHADPKACWVTFRELPPGTYLEGGIVRAAPDALEVSPLVSIHAQHGRSAMQRASAMKAAAAAVGAGLGSDPANVFVEYHELAAGHVFTGGQVR
jgi:phenylpyruvate tautomerase PptA (4-oxalocrotonate tautomerase family)